MRYKCYSIAVLRICKHPDAELNLAVAIRANQYAFVEFLFDLFPRASIAFRADAEFFRRRIEVVKIENARMLIITTAYTLATFILNRFEF